MMIQSRKAVPNERDTTRQVGRQVGGKDGGKDRDHDALREELERAVGPVLFSDLRAHLVRDAVFLVAPEASLAACALAIATDDVAEVKRLLTTGTLRKPTAEEREMWANSPGRRWDAVVVQPYVLVQ